MSRFYPVGRTGLSLVELIMTLSILSILAALILPSAHLMAKRNREIELRRDLRIIRNAIDDYKKVMDDACIKAPAAQGCTVGETRYPKSFDVLVDGVDIPSSVKSENRKFLRKVPCDPFRIDKSVTCDKSWGVRAYSDKECSDKLGGNDIYDICSLSEETAIDGTKYKEW